MIKSLLINSILSIGFNLSFGNDNFLIFLFSPSYLFIPDKQIYLDIGFIHPNALSDRIG